uniref:Uncharacterized protein n=1 Tax=Rhizophora mucronata TaxID=61149 RepID=A0A2P2Q7Y7_RHIMU
MTLLNFKLRSTESARNYVHFLMWYIQKFIALTVKSTTLDLAEN